MQSPFRRSLFLASAAAVLVLTGCLNQMTLGTPLPELDYQHIAPVYVSMGRVDVVNNFHPTAASDRAASAFPTRPENALNHYAENRLKAKGYEGTLKFIIDDATVRHSIVQPDNTVLKWVSLGVQDRYDVSVKITLARIDGDGRDAADANIQLNRFITVSKSDSIAKRQTVLKDFTQKLIEEIDGMVIPALRDRMHLIAGEDELTPAATPADNNDGSQAQAGPPVSSAPVPSVHPEALPPQW